MRKVTIAALLIGLLASTARATERPVTDVDAMAGKALYQRWCSGCHGERGDGAGPAAEFLDPRPRDFTKKVFKFRTTPSGQPPATADVLRVIERGVAGTAMPPFTFLPEADRKKIAAYVLYVADLIDGPEPTPIAEPGTPPATTAETIARGKQFYTDSGCNSCHGDGGKGDGSTDLKDADGRPIKARDLTEGVYRGGGERVDLYYRIATGLDGTPMPGYGDALGTPDLFAMVDYVVSLKAAPAATPLPADPIAAGREVTARHGCRGCHVLDDGNGGDVGPDLRFSALKLDPTWERAFLKAPDEYGKIYPWRVWAMPRIPVTQEEIDALGRYIAAMGKHPDKPIAPPDAQAFPAAKLEEGKNLFVLRCAQCHALGKVIETPLAAQQGPDLIRVVGRLDYAWAKDWILDPKKIDPKTRMTATDFTPEQADAVRMFVWKTSIEAGAGVHATAERAATP
jgi:mono/diheme cytochrome c family protein